MELQLIALINGKDYMARTEYPESDEDQQKVLIADFVKLAEVFYADPHKAIDIMAGLLLARGGIYDCEVTNGNDRLTVLFSAHES